MREDIDLITVIAAMLASGLSCIVGVAAAAWIDTLGIRKLKKENEDLRETVRWMDQTDARWSAAIKDLEKERLENDALRELTATMLRWMPCDRPCHHCERYRYPDGCEFMRRATELGVVAWPTGGDGR